MVTIGMNYAVLPGKGEVFERAFKSVLEAMKGDPGHTHSRLFRDVDVPSTYLILSDWNDKQAFDTFIRSETFKRVANWGKEQILAGRPSHQVYETNAS